MYTNHKFNGKTYQFNTAACFKMGKEAFVKAHAGVPNILEAWEVIEKNSPVPEKVKKDKP